MGRRWWSSQLLTIGSVYYMWPQVELRSYWQCSIREMEEKGATSCQGGEGEGVVSDELHPSCHVRGPDILARNGMEGVMPSVPLRPSSATFTEWKQAYYKNTIQCDITCSKANKSLSCISEEGLQSRVHLSLVTKSLHWRLLKYHKNLCFSNVTWYCLCVTVISVKVLNWFRGQSWYGI